MSHSLCKRCSIQSACSLNYDGEPCRKERDVEPTCFDVIMDMDVEELADFLSEWYEDRKAWKGDGGMVEEFLNDPTDRMPRRYRRAES